MLVAFGLFKIIAGVVYKTPVAIQPMKAIGTAAISHAGAVIHGLVLGLGLAFFLEGIKLAEGDFALAAVAVALTFALLSYERVPAMLLLLGLKA